MIASILKQAGYRVGLYTSPHLLSYTERIRVGGQPIAEAEWAALTEFIKPHVEAVNREGTFGELTTFEIFTAMAFTHFRDAKADYQVLEVGLGGGVLDAAQRTRLADLVRSYALEGTTVQVLERRRIAWDEGGTRMAFLDLTRPETRGFQPFRGLEPAHFPDASLHIER